ncbi:non-homologous end-joining DNA ligase [Streptomyces sp. NPDC058308]|uniref:non-homologous end-joining DNA ligase n=1 Tax=Streptomyces sp. NPDC058308 TaxID=3346440 RepID=UPI0036E535A0
MAPLPRLAPMLATSGSLPPSRTEHLWSAETKYDGQRALVYLPGDRTVVIRSRSGADITPAYPELHALADVLGDVPTVLDGEIVVLDEAGRPDFERLQPRMGLSGSPAKAARLAAGAPVHLVLFDVLFLAGQDLTGLPYVRRREALEQLVEAGPRWSAPRAVVGQSGRSLELAREHGLEGIVLKRLDSVYEPGRRSPNWVKIRNVRTVDVVVGGWLPGHGRLTGLPGAVLVGQYQDGALSYRGSVGTGWNERQRTELAHLLSIAAMDECPFAPEPAVPGARWVLPRLVAEVRYTALTRAGLLRHPVWHRLRPDLVPEK